MIPNKKPQSRSEPYTRPAHQTIGVRAVGGDRKLSLKCYYCGGNHLTRNCPRKISGLCYQYGKVGHLARDYPNVQRQMEGCCHSRTHMIKKCPRKGKGLCFHCGRIGHMAKDCPFWQKALSVAASVTTPRFPDYVFIMWGAEVSQPTNLVPGMWVVLDTLLSLLFDSKAKQFCIYLHRCVD